jgi:predicted HTH domain antitoxin
MSTITVECPDEVLLSLKEQPAEAAVEFRVAAAMKLFELGKLTSGRAAQLAGLSRVEFLQAAARYRVPAFRLTAEEVEQDAANA